MMSSFIQKLSIRSHYLKSSTCCRPATNGRVRWLSSSSSFLSRAPTVQQQSMSFQVAKVSYDGTFETVNLQTSELLKTASIYPRDLFLTLNLTSRQERKRHRRLARRTHTSVILPREGLILLSFGNVRAVATVDHVILFDAHSPLVQDFARNLASVYATTPGKLDGSQGEKEYNELVFLEEALRDTTSGFSRRLRLFEPIVDSFLGKVEHEVYSDTGVAQLVPLKNALQKFELQVKQGLDCLTNLLNSDEEMLDLLLTEQAKATQSGKEVAFERHEHVELLLGVYATQLSNVAMEVSLLLQRLQSKQEFISLALAGYRNRMIRMNVHLAIAGLSLSLGTAVAGFFGMNLISGLEESPFAFSYVLLGSGIGGMTIAAASLNYLSGHRMQSRAYQRIQENETLSGALSDMCALDYAVKHMVDAIQSGQAVNKDEFRRLLKWSRQSKTVTQEEVDLLFDILDRIKDGELTQEDFSSPSIPWRETVHN